ncbi:MAG: hypothetical protein J7641_12925 [Cyanobacteria bacterium SID2]|nr:hypothetical protein [Cyanobacteria bacterium SID2]MBP0004691.1 hypothetical protein [Cyanobacteria bacterium SBC]
MLVENLGRGSFASIEAKNNSKVALPSMISARLMSHTPGRLRFRVASVHRHPSTMAQIAQILQVGPVERVRINPCNGGVTIYYDRDRAGIDRIEATLQELPIAFKTSISDRSEAATHLTDTIAAVNRQVDRATEGEIDLRFLVPLGFGTLALRQLMVEGLQLEVIPWYALAWYAFDSFIKLHYTL